MPVETMSEEAPPGTVRESVTDDDLYEALREYWHPVAYVSEVIDGGPLAVTLLEEPLVLARIDGQVSAFRDICVHRGTALSLGSVDENGLRCGYHGWCYDGEGRCTKIPARPELKIPSRAQSHRRTPVRHYRASKLVADDPGAGRCIPRQAQAGRAR